MVRLNFKQGFKKIWLKATLKFWKFTTLFMYENQSYCQPLATLTHNWKEVTYMEYLIL